MCLHISINDTIHPWLCSVASYYGHIIQMYNTVQHSQLLEKGNRFPTLGSKDSCQALSQLSLCFVVGLHEDPQKLWWEAIPQYTLSEQAHSASVDPCTEGLHMKHTIQSDSGFCTLFFAAPAPHFSSGQPVKVHAVIALAAAHL